MFILGSLANFYFQRGKLRLLDYEVVGNTSVTLAPYLYQITNVQPTTSYRAWAKCLESVSAIDRMCLAKIPYDSAN